MAYTQKILTPEGLHGDPWNVISPKWYQQFHSLFKNGSAPESPVSRSILISVQVSYVYDQENSTNVWDLELSDEEISSCRSDIRKNLYTSKHCKQRHDDLKVRNIGGNENF
ncbi:hypothetical protein B9Z55_003085 [Caenorhabditis nigoni]|uniref:DUSP domain-containing protein n=1 Tax=Caenorhabditis nigoni TaxID=1611254 RepID=A0A2G5VP42_9PELO|nr:hypothetical protein B9Z55_003085 [Caenorhabditis nigoni]